MWLKYQQDERCDGCAFSNEFSKPVLIQCHAVSRSGSLAVEAPAAAQPCCACSALDGNRSPPSPATGGDALGSLLQGHRASRWQQGEQDPRAEVEQGALAVWCELRGVDDYEFAPRLVEAASTGELAPVLR